MGGDAATLSSSLTGDLTAAIGSIRLRMQDLGEAASLASASASAPPPPTPGFEVGLAALLAEAAEVEAAGAPSGAQGVPATYRKLFHQKAAYADLNTGNEILPGSPAAAAAQSAARVSVRGSAASPASRVKVAARRGMELPLPDHARYEVYRLNGFAGKGARTSWGYNPKLGRTVTTPPPAKTKKPPNK